MVKNFKGFVMDIKREKEKIINKIIAIEGGYSDNEKDSGGKTRYGITIFTARKNGYRGDMRDLPLEFAKKVYDRRYLQKIKFESVAKSSLDVAKEMADTAINMGWYRANRFLQRALNILNRGQRDYRDIKVDGVVGRKTLNALEAYLKRRGKEGERVLLKILNSMQGAKYIELAETREKDEEFIYGWFKERVEI